VVEPQLSIGARQTQKGEWRKEKAGGKAGGKWTDSRRDSPFMSYESVLRHSKYLWSACCE